MSEERKSVAVIKKMGEKYCVFSEDGKNMGCSPTREGAVKRLKQVEFFKKTKADDELVDADSMFSDVSIEIEYSMADLDIVSDEVMKPSVIFFSDGSVFYDDGETIEEIEDPGFQFEEVVEA